MDIASLAGGKLALSEGVQKMAANGDSNKGNWFLLAIRPAGSQFS